MVSSAALRGVQVISNFQSSVCICFPSLRLLLAIATVTFAVFSTFPTVPFGQLQDSCNVIPRISIISFADIEQSASFRRICQFLDMDSPSPLPSKCCSGTAFSHFCFAGDSYIVEVDPDSQIGVEDVHDVHIISTRTQS